MRQLTPEPGAEQSHRQAAEHEHRPVAGAVEHEAEGGDAGRLPHEQREGEKRDGGPARVGRHLRRIGLQCVVEQEESEPHEECGEEGIGPVRQHRHHDEPDQDDDTARPYHAALPETADDRARQDGVKQAAQAETGEKQANRAVVDGKGRP